MNIYTITYLHIDINKNYMVIFFYPIFNKLLKNMTIYYKIIIEKWVLQKQNRLKYHKLKKTFFINLLKYDKHFKEKLVYYINKKS